MVQSLGTRGWAKEVGDGEKKELSLNKIIQQVLNRFNHLFFLSC